MPEEQRTNNSIHDVLKKQRLSFEEFKKIVSKFAINPNGQMYEMAVANLYNTFYRLSWNEDDPGHVSIDHVERDLKSIGWRPPEALNHECKWTSTPPGVSKWEGVFIYKEPEWKTPILVFVSEQGGKDYPYGLTHYSYEFTKCLSGSWFGPLEIPEYHEEG